MSYLLICYPKCSTCQRAKKWLEDNGVAYRERNIKQENPSKAEIAGWYARSKLSLKRFFNTSGLLYREHNLAKRLPLMNDEEQLDLLATDGMLVKRPILVGEDCVLVGFRESEWTDALAMAT